MLEQLIKLYYEDKLSLRVIAKQLGTYPLNLKRMLNDAGYQLRDKSESQKLALETGRSEHPTDGKTQKLETRRKISRSMSKVWQARPKEMVDQFKERCKKRIAEQTDEERAKHEWKRKKGLRDAGVIGSKIEKYIIKQLRFGGYRPKFRVFGLAFLENSVDILIPDDKIVLEIDGPAHCYPERFPKMEAFLQRESQKNHILLDAGYHVIRVRIKDKSFTIPYKEKIWQNIQEQVERLILETKPKLIFLEVNK